MTRKSFTYNTLFMTFANIITRFIGFAYRIFLSRVVGAEGLGLFGLISPIYAICCAVVASGMPVSAMKNISENLALNDKEGAKASTISSLILVLVISLTLFILLLLFAPSLAIFIGDIRTMPSILILSFAVLITGFENIYKSSFYSDSHVLIPAITEICEQIFRITLVVFLILTCKNLTATVSSAILTFGIFWGEAISLIILFFSYLIYTRKIKLNKKKLPFMKILSTACPVTLSKTAETLLSSASNILIPAMLVFYGLSRSEALEILGVISGMVMPLLFLPAVFTNALSVNLLPFISANLASGNSDAIKRKVEKVLVVTSIFSFPAFFLLAFYAKNISEVVFSDSRVAIFLPLMAIGAIFATFRHIFISILNASSLAKKASLYNFCANGIQILFILIFVPFIGVYGYILSYVLSSILLIFPTLNAAFSLVKLKKNVLKKLFPPLLASCIAFSLSNFIFALFPHFLSSIMELFLSLTISSFLYLLIIYIMYKNKKIIFFSKIT